MTGLSRGICPANGAPGAAGCESVGAHGGPPGASELHSKAFVATGRSLLLAFFIVSLPAAINLVEETEVVHPEPTEKNSACMPQGYQKAKIQSEMEM